MLFFIDQFYKFAYINPLIKKLMSTDKHYQGTTDAGRQTYMTNFAAKIGGYASTLGISPTQVTQIQNDAQDLKNMLAFLAANKTYHHNVTEYKDLLLHGDKAHTAIGVLGTQPALPVFSSTLAADIMGRNATLVAQIKNHSGYTAAIGKDLGIVATGTGTGTHTTTTSGATEKEALLKPNLKGKLNKGNLPYLYWKKGTSHALRLMVDRSDGKGFVLVTVATHHSYIDKWPLPLVGTSVIWHYKGVYLDTKEEPIGEYSDVVEIMVKGV